MIAREKEREREQKSERERSELLKDLHVTAYIRMCMYVGKIVAYMMCKEKSLWQQIIQSYHVTLLQKLLV